MANTTYDQLIQKFELLKAEFPTITFGYIGNIGVDRSGPYDDTSWYVFLPHPGRVGTYEDSVGGYRKADLDKMLANWDSIAETVRKRMVGR